MALQKVLTEKRLTPLQWVTEGKVKGKLRESVGEATQHLRLRFLAIYALSNGKQTAQEVVEGISTDKALYDSAKNLLAYCRDTLHNKISTIAEWRTMLPGFLDDVFGSDFDKKTFEEQVPIIKSFVTTKKAGIERDDLVRILRMNIPPRDRALLYTIAYGLRRGELISRRLEDIDDKGQYAVVKLWADQTKTRESRQQFISKEGLDLIREYRRTLPEGLQSSPWVFPGEKGNHLSGVAAYRALKKLFRDGGLKDKEREVFSPHGFRTFAEDIMRECGLSDTYARQIVGHDTGTEENYQNWKAIEKAWVSKCLERTTWLSDKQQIITEQSKRLSKLEKGFSELVNAVLEGSPDKKKIAERLRAKYALEDKTEPTGTSEPTGAQSGN